MPSIKDKPWDRSLKALANITTTPSKKLEDAKAKVRLYAKSSKAMPRVKVQELSSISSPLVEKANSRTYHTERVLWSSDGYFSFVHRPLKQVTFVDQKGQEIVFQFLDTTV